MRRIFSVGLVAIGTMLIAERAPAQAATAETEDARYSYNRVDDGFLRLDSHSGEVSLCNRRAVGWSCELVPDDRGALDNEIARLHGENAILKKALLDRGLPLPRGVNAESASAGAASTGAAGAEVPSTKNNDRDLALPSQADVERVKALVGKVWRQLVEMIMNLQKDVLKKT
jgi:hypothetical protein